MSVFFAEHHDYRFSTGVDDTKFGRAMMAGLGRNPTLEILRSNGYRIQYVHHLDYFVNERGVLDFVYPVKPAWSVLGIFSSPLLERLVGAEHIVPGRRTRDDHKRVLLERIREAATSGPWFTFAHVALPAHSMPRTNWRDLAPFEEEFRQRTRDANAHMLEVMDAIAAVDPGAVVIIAGDHGAWRYRDAAEGRENPADALAAAGIAPETMALDLFGIMIAVRATNGCDQPFYATVTPVNLMRILFACLSGRPDVMGPPAEDVSIYQARRRRWQDPSLWVTARDGHALPSWEPRKKD
jgi:hypothetical protein